MTLIGQIQWLEVIVQDIVISSCGSSEKILKITLCNPFTEKNCIYIYIYIYLLINYLPVFTVPEKNKKPLARNKRKKYLESRSRGKRKKFFGVKKKEKTNLVLLLEKNQGVLSQWPKENQKTLREYCNAIITKVLNIKQWSQL